ncbi:hypothetical protein ACEOIK_30075, partial [Pseudomonas aeruginosa]|uniref:hypothetical protein n=1 Tax=Pseudomonas aeruginosa TaxID=287 RepID=UPI001CA495F5
MVLDLQPLSFAWQRPVQFNEALQPVCKLLWSHQLRLPLIASRYASYEMRDAISSPQSLTRLLTSANVTVTVGIGPSLLTLNESCPGSGFPLLSHKIRHVPVFFS